MALVEEAVLFVIVFMRGRLVGREGVESFVDCAGAAAEAEDEVAVGVRAGLEVGLGGSGSSREKMERSSPFHWSPHLWSFYGWCQQESTAASLTRGEK